MRIRNARMSDLNKLTALEAQCFPVAEAATKKTIKARLKSFSNHFWLLEDDEENIISFICGMVINNTAISDIMFEDPSMHDEQGMWQSIFSVCTEINHRRNGAAEEVMNKVIMDAKNQGRKGLVLTCKDKLIHYYEKFGFVNCGISSSKHGDAIWYDMRLTFKDE